MEMMGGLGVIGLLFVIFLIFLWILLPFAVFGLKDLVAKTIEEQKTTNKLLNRLLELTEAQQIKDAKSADPAP